MNTPSKFDIREHEQGVHSFSGSDVLAYAEVGTSGPIFLGNMGTFSYSIFREKEPVRRLGRVRAQGYTSGPRTIAGSMVMLTFEKSALDPLLDYVTVPDREQGQLRPKADEIVPFTMSLVARNEFGDVSALRLTGMEIASEGFVTGTDELYLETTFQYVATDIYVLDTLFNQTTQDRELAQAAQRRGEVSEWLREQDQELTALENARYESLLMQQREAEIRARLEQQDVPPPPPNPFTAG